MEKNKVLYNPIILYETIEAIYGYANRFSYQEKKNEIMMKYGQKYTTNERKEVDEIFNILGEIQSRVCENIDLEDTKLQYYFTQWETDNKWQKMCLAKLMAYSFLDIASSDCEESFRQIQQISKKILSEPYEIGGVNSGGISFEKPKTGNVEVDLVNQLDQLDLKDEYRWQLFKLLTDFTAYLEELKEVVLPVAQRMKEELEHIRPLLHRYYSQWETYFQQNTFAHLLMQLTNQHVEEDELMNYINLNIMACCDLIYTYNTLFDKNYRQIYVGMLIDDRFSLNRIVMSNEAICNMLKVISDRSKFEILCKLSEKTSYGQELAKEMNLTTATISRHMAILQDAGLVHTRRGESRIYYDLNQEAVENLFQVASSTIVRK